MTDLAPVKPYYDECGITLYCGDCADVLADLPPDSVDLVITDPPYFKPVAHYVAARGEKAHKKSLGDASILEIAFKTLCRELARIVKPSGTIYWFCDGQSYGSAFAALYPHAKHVRPLIWDKITSYNGYTWRHQHELIAWAEMAESERVPTGDGDILRYRAVPVEERVHPAQKPTQLISALMTKHTAGVVLDPFAGSGSTLRAAKNLGRRAIGIEIEERYCEIAVEHMAQDVLFGEAA